MYLCYAPAPGGLVKAVVLASFLLVSFSSAVAAQTFTATWKNPAAGNVTYAGRKVVGLIVSNDMPLRQSTEEALARELTAKGVRGIPAYQMIPKEEIRDKDRAKAWFERTDTAGVVLMRLVDMSKETRPTVVAWESAPYYGSLWGYYPYAWGVTFDLTPNKTKVTVAVETLVFDVKSNKLLWAGTSNTSDAKDAQDLVKKLVNAAAEQMRKDGLISRN
jgi:hypothetical protein